MNIEKMKEIEQLAHNKDNMRYILNDIIMQGKGLMELADEIGISFGTLKSFLLEDRPTQHVPRMKIAQYCLKKDEK